MESIDCRFAFPSSTILCDFVPFRGALQNPKYLGYSLGVLVDFETLYRGLFPASASRSGMESIETRFAFPSSIIQCDFVPFRDALRNPKYQGYSLGVLVDFETL